MSLAWAALLLAAVHWLTWPLLIGALAAGPSIAASSRSFWPLLAPAAVLAAFVGWALIWPVDPVQCVCEPMTASMYFSAGLTALAVLAACYAVGYLLRRWISRVRGRGGGWASPV